MLLHRHLSPIFAIGLAMTASSAIAQSASDTSKTDFGGAEPLNLTAWFTPDDFPNEAIRAGSQGRVVVNFDIGIDGRVTNCVVAQAARDSRLNKVPCSVLERRARFKPATDAAGNPVATRGTWVQVFKLG
jgi:TonB family protein